LLKVGHWLSHYSAPICDVCPRMRPGRRRKGSDYRKWGEKKKEIEKKRKRRVLRIPLRYKKGPGEGGGVLIRGSKRRKKRKEKGGEEKGKGESISPRSQTEYSTGKYPG